MPLVRGLVLMSRLEYLENRFGSDVYRDFLKKISTEGINFIRQPLEGAMSYPDTMLRTIDQILLADFFENDIGEFKILGRWGAENFMFRFFSQYVDEQKPVEFLAQYGRLRYHLIGNGEMVVQPLSASQLELSIDYGQKIQKSICLSEQGFIEGGMKQCGAQKILITETACAGEADDFICRFSIRFKEV